MFFPSRNLPGHHASVAAYERLFRRYLKEHPDVERFIPRDIRRSWKSLTGAARITKETRDRLQKHARGDVSSKHYDRWDYLPEKRTAMDVWSKYLDRILAGELDNPVTRLQVEGGPS